jgi:hypothetical protein
MFIRVALGRILAKPLLIPLGLTTVAFWYGNFKVSTVLLQNIVGLDQQKLDSYKKFRGNISALVVSGLVFYIRPFGNILSSSNVNSDKPTNNPVSMLNKVKRVLPGKAFFATIFLSSVSSATVSVFVKKYL